MVTMVGMIGMVGMACMVGMVNMVSMVYTGMVSMASMMIAVKSMHRVNSTWEGCREVQVGMLVHGPGSGSRGRVGSEDVWRGYKGDGSMLLVFDQPWC